MSEAAKMTRQGLRDLNSEGHRNPRRRTHASRGCGHVWETHRTYECWTETWETVERCGFCHEVRR